MSSIKQQQLGLGIIATGVVFWLGYVALNTEGGVFSAVTASWAQAMFTVLAVGASALVANWPIQHEIQRRADERKALISNIRASMDIAFRHHDALAEAARTGNMNAFMATKALVDENDDAAFGSYGDLSAREWPSPSSYAQGVKLWNINNDMIASLMSATSRSNLRTWHSKLADVCTRRDQLIATLTNDLQR